MKTKVSTNREQSKKLIELGIDKNTADCYLDYLLKEPIPSWSLTALLELMPTKVNDNFNLVYHLTVYRKENGWAIRYMNGNEELIGFFSDNIFNVVFEMIIWLLENNKI